MLCIGGQLCVLSRMCAAVYVLSRIFRVVNYVVYVCRMCICRVYVVYMCCRLCMYKGGRMCIYVFKVNR